MGQVGEGGDGVKDPERIKAILRELFREQQFAVMATREADGQPYASLMAFAVSDDLRHILLVTSRSTRKYANLSADPRVSLLIDSRSRGSSRHQSADIHEAVAVTVLGEAEEVTGAERDRLQAHYLAKHPHLESFATSPTCALLRVRVKSYYLVSRFQEVVELHVRP
jgi:nitroimidazol reductase NimA-like FMN-containing flavoprotein (pyridoxamine 5'-phosphate oxidase superfamily)